MSDILIVTSRNVVTPGGEFSLIINRAAVLEKQWGISSDMIALCNTNLGVKEGNEAFGNGVYVRRNFKNPFSLVDGYRQLIKEVEHALRDNQYKVVLLSGVGLLRYVKRIKKCAEPGTLVCADVHGYFGDGKLLARDESAFMGAFHYLAATVEEFEQKTYLKAFDRIFAVSSAYREFLCKQAGCSFDQFYIVPCATGELPQFNHDEQNMYRNAFRDKYGIVQNELLMVYSGGVSSWQCLPETISLYKQIKRIRTAKLLILSGDRDGARAVAQGEDGVLIDSYKPNELPKVFCAADCFVMLRADLPTNHYAFPNKFLEYVASHKPVIVTPYVYDIASCIADDGVGVVYNGNVNSLIASLDGFQCDEGRYDSVVNRHAFKKTLEPFVSDIAALA